MMHFTRSLLFPVSILALLCASACAEDSKDKGDDDDDDGASGGTAGTGGTGATGSVLIVPDASGWIERDTNPIGIQGAWYPYGDQYGIPGKCITVGLHPAAECSEIFTPIPPPLGTPPTETVGGFPNTGGEMCTTGATAIIKPCMPNVLTEGCPADDFSNMWGAGIGFDLNAAKGEDGGLKSVWPVPADIIGFTFEINAVPQATKLRVEIPVALTDAEAAAVGLPNGSTSDDHPKGAPYWGATSMYPPSNVVPGVNRVLWTDIKHPTGAIDLMTTPLKARMLGIQFHTPAMAKSATAKGEFNYCVKNITFITQ